MGIWKTEDHPDRKWSDEPWRLDQCACDCGDPQLEDESEDYHYLYVKCQNCQAEVGSDRYKFDGSDVFDPSVGMWLHRHELWRTRRLHKAAEDLLSLSKELVAKGYSMEAIVRLRALITEVENER